MGVLETVVGLLAAVAALAALAGRVGVPYPPVLVLGGLVFGLIPGVPTPVLEPKLVLFLFLPPLIYASAFRVASLPVRGNALQIVVLSVGLVVATLSAVAAVGRALAGIPWVAAFALGGLLGATDPVSASAIVRRMGAPDRLVAILEGEALLNDGTGLAAFSVAVASVGGGLGVGRGFSLGYGVLRFLEISVGGLVVGVIVGVAAVRVRRRVQEPSLEIVLGLLTAFGAYAAADAAGFSGVLAAVAAGLCVGARSQAPSSPSLRLRVEPFWEALTFVLDSLLFLLIGLELRQIVDGLHGHGVLALVGVGAVATVIAIVVRGAWMATVTRGIPPLAARMRPAAVPRLGGPELVVLGWSGMRGALSLAGALSIPIAVDGHPFPARDEVIFLVYCVVLGTLVVPSLTLEPLVRRLGLGQSDQRRRETLLARRHVIRAGLTRLDELAERDGIPERVASQARAHLELRLERLRVLEHGGSLEPPAQADAAHRLRGALLDAERAALAELWAERRIPASVLLDLQRDLDLDELRGPA